MARENVFELDLPDAEVSGHEDGRRCYTVEDLMFMLNLSRGLVYELLHQKRFKWFRVGKGKYRISKKSFDEWLDDQN